MQPRGLLGIDRPVRLLLQIVSTNKNGLATGKGRFLYDLAPTCLNPTSIELSPNFRETLRLTTFIEKCDFDRNPLIEKGFHYRA